MKIISSSKQNEIADKIIVLNHIIMGSDLDVNDFAKAIDTLCSIASDTLCVKHLDKIKGSI